MSRSYKKHPRVKDKNNKGMKKYANKKVRHTKDIPNGKAYKKVFESWDICDYCWIWTWKEAIDAYNQAPADSWIRKHFETLEKYLIYWEKCVRRK
ncbi:MAG TPA: hypothetical protein DCL29_02025 [Eubacterium sp.]|nr:hypothetical protein [Eubacterium sp.]